MKRHTLHRCLALLLCMAMLLPNFTGLATAVGSTDLLSSQTVSTWKPVANPFASGSVPAYATVNGVVSAEALEYDCGNGISNDGAKSYMTLVENTTYSEFSAYVNKLISAGFSRTFNRVLSASDDGLNNTFYRFLSPTKDYVLSVYYLEPYHEVRIIADTAEDAVKSFSGGFVYMSETNEVAQPMMTMYGLSMSPNGYDNTSKTSYRTGARNCGALIVIRMPDNSLFINDGGDIEQWSDEVCDDFMKFCRELTGKTASQKVVINTWFLSHAHSDHYDGIPRFFEQYHDSIDIKNVMYNIDDERKGTTRDISGVMQMIYSYFPDVKYYKPHTGDSFNIAGVEFDVLYAQEDRFVHNSAKKMVIDIRDGDETNTNENRDGTYRSFLYESGSIVNLSDFNDTSTVLKVNFPEGITGSEDVSSILYGDVNLADQVLLDIWPKTMLQTDIMMVPHHGHDAHPELVAVSNARIFLYTQAKSAIFGPNGIVDDGVDLTGTYRPALVENYLAMNGSKGENYFGTTDTRKTYWEGTETACILFGEDTEFQNMPSGLNRDTEDPEGFTVYTMDAPFFEYEGWKSVSTVWEAGESTSATGVAIDTSRIRFDLVTYSSVPTSDSRYLIVHDKTDNVLMYDPIATYEKQTKANLGTSMYVGSGAEASAGLAQAYYKVDDSSMPDVKNKASIYFARHLRNDALWITTQAGVEDGASFTKGTARFSGVHYKDVSMFKGLNTDDSYWYCVAGNDYSDGTGNQWRNLRPVYNPVFDRRAGDNLRIEILSDNTCLIYYMGTDDAYTDDEDENEEKVMRFLTVDESGHWICKEYYTDSSNSWSDMADVVKNDDLDSLKLRLYSYTTRSGAKTVSYEGVTNYQVLRGTSKDDLAAAINQSFRVIDSSVRNQQIPCSGYEAKVGCYWLDMSSYDGVNDCTITVKYRNDDGSDSTICTLNIDVVDHYATYVDYNDDDSVYAGTRYGSKYGFVYQGSSTIYEDVVNYNNLMDMTVVVRHYESGVTTSVVSVTPDMLLDSKGNPVNTSVLGEHTGLNLVYDGQVIGENFILNVAANESALSKPAYPNPGSVLTDKKGTTSELDFLSTGVANIQLSATAVPLNRGVDLIIVMDLSGSMKNALDTNVDAVGDQQSRLDAMEKSLQAIIKELQDSNQDIRIAMSDFGDLDHYNFTDSVMVDSVRDKAFYDLNLSATVNPSFEFYNHLNWVYGADDQAAGSFTMVGHKFNQAHSQYTGQVIPEVYTGSFTANAGAFVDVDDLTEPVMTEIISKLNANANKAIGTNYDVGLEYAYQLGYSIRQQNIQDGEDRELVCIFMSDGAAIQYNYLSGNAESSSWADVLMGKPDEITSMADYFANQDNWPVEIEQISKVLLTKLTTAFDDTEKVYSAAFSTLFGIKYRSQIDTRYYTYVPDKTRDNALYFYTYMDDQGYPLYSWEYLYDLAIANGYVCENGETFTPEYYHNTDNVLEYLVTLLTTPRSEDKIVYKVDADGNPVYETDENGNVVQAIESFESKLQNPYYRDLGRTDVSTDPAKVPVAAYKYLKLADYTIDHTRSYTEQFFEAMESIGEPCDWSIYARLAEVNKKAIQAEYGLENPRDLFRSLIEKMKTPVEGFGDYQTLSPYDYFYNSDGKNWWAEAMKGEVDKLYPVINQYAYSANPAWGSNAYYGTVRNHFTTGTGLKLDGQNYISGHQGLGMDLYTISFSICDDRLLTTDVAENVLKNVASGHNFFFAANTQDDLTNVLKVITSSMSGSASKAWYTDTMGPDFDLSTESVIVDHDGNEITVNANPTIRVMEYDMIPVTDASGNIINYVRSETPRIIEVVTFEDIDGDGDVDAWSNLIYTNVENNGVIERKKVDIWDETTGLISAKNFYYNANVDVSVNVNFGEQGKFALAPETFFWVIGVIGQTDMVLEYQVYLTGSIEGDRLLTSEDYYHATNTNADLHYINYLGQNSTYGTETPKYPWGDAKVGVAYYLVNENGEMIANRITGETTTDITKAIKLTRPEYEYMLWNGDYTELGTDVTAAEKRPEGHTLYSPQAGYSADMTFNGSGSWTVSDSTATTYVQAGDNYYNQSQSYGEGAYSTGDTVVWFAVVDKSPVTSPDTVVVDYGLPVDIDVVGNDILLGKKGSVEALGAFSTNIGYSGTTLNSGYSADAYPGQFGTATIEGNKVHYELSGTEINGYERFNYAVRYVPAANENDVYSGYYYNTVTIIPATIIYYEESFAEFDTYVLDSTGRYVWTETDKWSDAKDENYEDLKDAHQDQDRPGQATLPEIDADNLYGFDSAYATSSKYSMGLSQKFTANANDAGTVTFSFYGTGFDVVSLTSNDTGTIMVDVYNAEGYVRDQSTPIHSYVVDTYYGYTYDMEKNEWIVTENGKALYQVPVMKVDGLDYGHYTAVITVAYADFFDHKLSDESYDFYMDAIRIYDPAGDDVAVDSVIGDAYGKDGEYAPIYEELRNILLTEREFYDHTEESLGVEYLHGAVFIDGIPTLDDDHYDTSFKKDPPCIGTFMNYGPNNEVYLAPGQAIAFKLNGIEGLKAAHMALKSTEGTAKIKLFTTDKNIANVSQMDITTATDRYYDLTTMVGKTVIIANVGTSTDGILSITNLKMTTDVEAMQTFSVAQVFTMSRRSANMALTCLTIEEQAPGEEIPPTGDSSFVFFAGIMAMLCTACVGVLVVTNRKQKGE